MSMEGYGFTKVNDPDVQRAWRCYREVCIVRSGWLSSTISILCKQANLKSHLRHSRLCLTGRFALANDADVRRSRGSCSHRREQFKRRPAISMTVSCPILPLTYTCSLITASKGRPVAKVVYDPDGCRSRRCGCWKGGCLHTSRSRSQW